jgi:TP901 family phage tail tape measure protein
LAGKFTLEAVFRAVDKLTAPVGRMSASLTKFQKKASAGLADIDAAVGKATDGLRQMAAAAAIVGAGVGLAAMSIGKTGADFEQAITNVGAVSLMTRDQIGDLEKKALELGASTKFSATEVANAMEMMGKAGFENSEILQGIGGILSAAAAEGAGLEETASNVSNVLKGMGLATSESARVADVLTLASARTNSSISSLGESMKNVASTARQLGVPLEDTVSMVALLQDVGLDASEAGSATATMLTKLSAPSKAATAQMRAMGVSFQDASGNMLAPTKVLEQLVKAAEKSGGNMKQVAFFAELVGLRGQKAALNLQDLFKKGKVEELTEQLRHASGSAEKMASIRMDTLLGDIEQLGGSVDTLKIALFNTQSGPLRGIVQGLRDWLDANQDVIQSGFVEFVKQATPVLVGFGDGVKAGFERLEPLARGAASVLGNLFGQQAQGAQAQAFFWGERIVWLAGTFVAVTTAVKVARIAVFAFGVVTRTVQAATFLFSTAIKGAQAALVLYETWTKAGAAGTIALQFATKAAAVDMAVAETSAFAAAGGFQAMAVSLGAAAAAFGALYMAYDQYNQLASISGGSGGVWAGVKGAVGLGDNPNDWGLEGFAKGVDDFQNKQARKDAAARGWKDSPVNKYDGPIGYGDAAQNPQQGGKDWYGLNGPKPAPATAAPAAQPQVVPPSQSIMTDPAAMRDLFKSTIDVNIKDPGKVVDSVEVKNPGKTLAPVNPRSGTN